MVARGDLGMEIPSEKVCLAQKYMITKANLAGKFVITATQMLASMETNPLPTRAEMTDVANAVFDGTDATMLSGESANGKFPDLAVATMAAIVQNAEEGVSVQETFKYIRNFTPKPMTAYEATCSSAVEAAIDMDAKLIAIVTNALRPALLVAKYRPPVPVIVLTNNRNVRRVGRVCIEQYALHFPVCKCFWPHVPLLPRLPVCATVFAAWSAPTCPLPSSPLPRPCTTPLTMRKS